MAAFYGHLDSSSLLIENGANPLYKNDFDQNMFEIIVDKDRIDLLKAVYEDVEKYEKSRNLTLKS